MKPDRCAHTGYPPYGSATSALKAGTKIVRHPLDTVVRVYKCANAKHYHFELEDTRQ